MMEGSRFLKNHWTFLWFSFDGVLKAMLEQADWDPPRPSAARSGSRGGRGLSSEIDIAAAADMGNPQTPMQTPEGTAPVTPINEQEWLDAPTPIPPTPPPGAASPGFCEMTPAREHHVEHRKGGHLRAEDVLLECQRQHAKVVRC
mmetsp:Transcript_43097/g.116318  ORF Transcript_43097/g.116318 Transcript_43097/m.116318 type:complete len:145 (-) Transcript_43097:1975-2409(-)|eukprot:CAMPEP_0119482450 /NCGR_PEP_ID=MMETSP1344-20130328/10294_1 /TAXON_ID=236787 /ORGANISM="Florenciella parvula, Strain CCMP2471" /LENGTH=144 /DNA_ID=CAMNT_0007516843 /DNA_START=586 /DNA_END=1020 /DNA_ORIENTATION=-